MSADDVRISRKHFNRLCQLAAKHKYGRCDCFDEVSPNTPVSTNAEMCAHDETDLGHVHPIQDSRIANERIPDDLSEYLRGYQEGWALASKRMFDEREVAYSRKLTAAEQAECPDPCDCVCHKIEHVWQNSKIILPSASNKITEESQVEAAPRGHTESYDDIPNNPGADLP